MINKLFPCLLLALALIASSSQAIDVDQLHEAVGYTLVAITAVPGEFEGGDFDKTVKLENGMIFEFNSYNYSYAYRPAVALFAKVITVEQLQKLGRRADRPLVLYKLLIEEDFYDVIRVR